MFEFNLIRSRRRSIMIEIEDDGSITVRAPRLMPMMAINSFVNYKQAWIQQKQQQVLQALKVTKKAFKEGETFLYLGQSYPLRLVDNGQFLEFNGKEFILPANRTKQANELFSGWYKHQARVLFTKRMDFHAEQMGVEYKELKLSSAIRRWGSCTWDNNIFLNWRLIMAPLEIIDYVIVHELSHITHHNHSRIYWQFVGRYMPDYKKRLNWIHQNGKLLQI